MNFCTQCQELERRLLLLAFNLLSESGTCQPSIQADVLSRHVVKQRLSINIGVLCDFVDFLCSSVILCGDHSGTILPHNVTVPRSWLLRFLNYDFPHFNKGIQTNYDHLLLAPIWDLLEQLRFGRDSGKPQKIIILRFLILKM